LDAGALWKLTDGLWFGAAFGNLNRPLLGKTAERLTPWCEAGLSWKIPGNIVVSFEMNKDGFFPPEFSGGFEYFLAGFVALRAGGEVATGTFSCGTGLTLDGCDLDYAVTLHPDLGISHYLSLTIRPGGW
jgi:hypothetical protein